MALVQSNLELDAFSLSSIWFKITATTGGVAPYSYQLRRAPISTAGAFGTFVNVGSATSSLSLQDTTATPGSLYAYDYIVTDSTTPTPLTATSSSLFATIPLGAINADAPYILQGAVYQNYGSSSTSGTATLRAAATAGNRLFLVVQTGTASPTITPPTGYTLIDSIHVTTPVNMNLDVYEKTGGAAGGETTFTVTQSIFGGLTFDVLEIAQSTGIGAHAISTAASSSATSFTAPGVTATKNNGLVLTSIISSLSGRMSPGTTSDWTAASSSFVAGHTITPGNLVAQGKTLASIGAVAGASGYLSGSSFSALGSTVVFQNRYGTLTVAPTTMTFIPGGATQTAVPSESNYTRGFTYASDNTAVATVNASGVVTQVGPGTCHITVSDLNGQTATVTVNVYGAPSVTPNTMTFSPTGAPQTATVSESGYGGTWTVGTSNSAVATATISGATVTVTRVGSGTCTITITDSQGQTTTIAVTVYGTESVSPANLSFASATAVAQTSTITESGFSGPWTVGTSNSAVATATISGAVVTVTPVGIGICTITVTDNLGTQATISVGVRGQLSVSVSGTVALYHTPLPFTVQEPGFTGTLTAVSSATGVVTVTASATGPGPDTFTLTPVAPGNSIITVSDGTYSIPFTVRVTGDLSLDVSTLAMATSGTGTINATEPYYDGPFTSGTSNNLVATVAATGLSDGPTEPFTVTPVGPGTCTITISDDHGGSQTVTVTVYGPLVVSTQGLTFIDVPSADQTFTVSEVGDTGAFTVTNSNPSVAAVSGSGSGPGPITYTVAPLSPGTTTVTVTDTNGQSQSFVVTVLISTNVKEGYRLMIFDTSGALVDVPQDLMTFSFEDAVNGGSTQGSFTVPRSFVDTGTLQPEFRVQLYLPDSIDPWWDGTIVDFDQEQILANDFEQITVTCVGWSDHLSRAITSDSLNPGIQPNGQNNGTMNADSFLNYLLGRYIDSSTFNTSYVASMPILLDKISYDGTGLNTAVDTVVQQVQDSTGNTFEWWVRGIKGGKPTLVIQPNQNPNKVTSGYMTPSATTPADFVYEFKDSTISAYKIVNSTKNLYNMIALYGGPDPMNPNLLVYGAFKDSTSISLYGLRQKKVTNSAIVSTLSLSNYAAVYLLVNGYPQPQGSFQKLVVSDRARAGRWFQVAETNFGTANQTIRQYRAVKVTLSLQNAGDKLLQVVSVNAPRPYIDEAYFGAIQQAKNAAAQMVSRPQAQPFSYCVLSGFDWLSSSVSGGTVSVHITPPVGQFATAASYSLPSGPNADGSYTVALTDSVTGLTGDGRYELVFARDVLTDYGIGTHTPGFVVVKSANPTPTNSDVLKGWQFTVVNGAIAGSRDLRVKGGINNANLPQNQTDVGTFTVSSVTAAVVDTGLGDYQSGPIPAIAGQFTVNETLTPDMSTWSFGFWILSRPHSAASATDPTTYTEVSTNELGDLKGFGNGSVLKYSKAVSPGVAYDLAVRVVDAHAKPFPVGACVPLATNVVVAPIGPTSRSLDPAIINMVNALPRGSNLALDASFEQALAAGSTDLAPFWKINTGATNYSLFEYDWVADATQRSGTKDILIRWPQNQTMPASSTNQGSVVYDLIPLAQVGDTFSFGGYVNIQRTATLAGCTYNAFLFLEVLYNDGSSGQQTFSTAQGVTGGYNRLFGTLVVGAPPTGKTIAGVAFAMYAQIVNNDATAKNAGAVYIWDVRFDDVWLVKQATPSDLAGGSAGDTADIYDLNSGGNGSQNTHTRMALSYKGNYDSTGALLKTTSMNNNTPNVIPITMDFAITTAFTSGTANMTWWISGRNASTDVPVSGQAVKFTFPDGVTTLTASTTTIVNGSSGTTGTSGSPNTYNAGTVGATVYALIYYSVTAVKWVITFQTTPITSAQIAAANADGILAVVASYTNGTLGTTGSTGGGSFHGGRNYS